MTIKTAPSAGSLAPAVTVSNSGSVTCTGDLTAADIHITGRSQTVASLNARVATLEANSNTGGSPDISAVMARLDELEARATGDRIFVAGVQYCILAHLRRSRWERQARVK